ncbi:hypothetical protein L249_0136, partial [Ophiocordyceps polyrhachis-furcata BCC 54312]
MTVMVGAAERASSHYVCHGSFGLAGWIIEINRGGNICRGGTSRLVWGLDEEKEKEDAGHGRRDKERREPVERGVRDIESVMERIGEERRGEERARRRERAEGGKNNKGRELRWPETESTEIYIRSHAMHLS